MQTSSQQSLSLAHKAAYCGGGSLVIFVLEFLALVYGVSDGSVIFVVPALASPFLGVLGIVLGAIALKRKNQSRRLASVGILGGGVCVLLFAGIFIYALLWVAAWNASS